MAFSPFHTKFNNTVIRSLAGVAIILFSLQIVLAQRARREPADKGPRATGLVELAPDGKAHLIPITIMVDGKFYDAGAYKASPIPMALEFGTVYEAEQSGVSQGIFTVKGARSGPDVWRGEGTWQSAAELQAEAAKRKAREAAKPAKKNDDTEGPPVLRRAGSQKPAPEKSGAEKSKTSAPEPAATPTSSGDKQSSSSPGSASDNPAGSASPSASTATPASASAPASASPSPSYDSDENDPDRPHLRRGKQASQTAPQVMSEVKDNSKPGVAAKTMGPTMGPKMNPKASGASSGIKLIPAVSDAGGPEPRPYAYDLKPDEERRFRTKMLALAALEVNAHANLAGSETAATPAPRTTRHKVKPPEPAFEDVQLRIFDLSNSNEPVLVLTAKATMPHPKMQDANPATSYLLTLVAREDIYGDLHKAFANVTDSQHLDVLPRLELIDAVDVDGDGHGELLFRQVSASGSGYVIYRVIGNQLWPLYQSPIG